MLTMLEDVKELGCGQVKFLSISGYLDASTISQFEQRMTRIVSENPRKMIVSFRGLEYINSAGIGLFLSTDRLLGQAGGKMVLVDMPAKICRILDVLGFSKILTITSDVQAAAERLTAVST
ncbi:MAG: STAS domain-containing protein [Planctomycetes bacterium]|nr:STAS domain-containing protein [Planctomycetota bacterium]